MAEQAPVKRYDDGRPPDPREAELVEDMTLDAMEYIFGEASPQIVKALRESTNTSQTMATIVYKAVRRSAEAHSATATIEMDMDMMMGVATAAIDMVTEVAEASGQVYADADVNTLKEDTLLRTVVMHGSTLDRTPEQRQQAMTDLRDYVASPGAQKAFDYVNERAAREGQNPQDMVRAGNEMLYGSMHPIKDTLSEGVKQGLMNGGPEATAPLQPEQGLMPAPTPAEQAVGRMRQAPQEAHQTPQGVPYYEDPQEMAQMYPEPPPDTVRVRPLGGQ